MNLCFRNGQLAENREFISAYNGSFLYGINCFEGLRGYYSATHNKLVVLDLDAHLDRLYASALSMAFDAPIEKSKLKAVIEDIIAEYKVQEDVYLRVTFYLDGETSWASQDTIAYIVSIRSMKSNFRAVSGLKNQSLTISSHSRISHRSMPPSIKAGANYLNSRYAQVEAKQRGFDGALFLTQSGLISESTGSCIFFISGDEFYTPSIDCDILNSITRKRVLELSRIYGWKMHESEIKPEFIDKSQGAFLVGTMMEISPIKQIDNTELSTASNPYFQTLVESFKNSIDDESIKVVF